MWSATLSYFLPLSIIHILIRNIPIFIRTIPSIHVVDFGDFQFLFSFCSRSTLIHFCGFPFYFALLLLCSFLFILNYPIFSCFYPVLISPICS